MVTLKIKYYSNGKFSHEYEEKYEHNQFICCPHCGKRSVWIDQSSGDWYVGSKHICVECGTAFYLAYL